MRREVSWSALVALAILVFPGQAPAHKLNLFATVEGSKIQGKAYFRGGTPARGVAVIARDPAGNELGRSKTDDEGKFEIVAGEKVAGTRSAPATSTPATFVLTSETEDGHGETLTVRADSPVAGPRSVPATLPEDPIAAAGNARVESQIESLRREVRELREQFAERESRAQLRDILGGIGYILGLCGVAYYILGRKRNR